LEYINIKRIRTEGSYGDIDCPEMLITRVLRHVWQFKFALW